MSRGGSKSRSQGCRPLHLQTNNDLVCQLWSFEAHRYNRSPNLHTLQGRWLRFQLPWWNPGGVLGQPPGIRMDLSPAPEATKWTRNGICLTANPVSGLTTSQDVGNHRQSQAISQHKVQFTHCGYDLQFFFFCMSIVLIYL